MLRKGRMTGMRVRVTHVQGIERFYHLVLIIMVSLVLSPIQVSQLRKFKTNLTLLFFHAHQEN